MSVENAARLTLSVLLLGYLVAACCRPLGAYMARVYAREHDSHVERVLYGLMGVDPKADQRRPAYAEGQIARVARERGLSAAQVAALVAEPAQGRTLGLLGEPRANVLELNLARDTAGRDQPDAANRTHRQGQDGR